MYVKYMKLNPKVVAYQNFWFVNITFSINFSDAQKPAVILAFVSQIALNVIRKKL